MRLRSALTAAILAAAGVIIPAAPASAAPDLSGPVLTSPSVTVSSTELGAGLDPVVVTVRIHLTDETGVNTPTIVASHQTTSQTQGFGRLNAEPGTTLQSGWWSRSFVIPANAAPGAWDITLYPLSDTLGNDTPSDSVSGFRTLKTIVLTPHTAAPVASELSVTPTKTSFAKGDVTVTASARVVDKAGTNPPMFMLEHAKAQRALPPSSATLKSGTLKDGVWEATWTVSMSDEDGLWTAKILPLSDQLGNKATTAVTVGTVQIDRYGTITPGTVTVSGLPASGELQPGTVLTAGSIDWSETDATITYKWLRDGYSFDPVGIGHTYTVTAEDAGARISVLAIASKPGYKDSGASSPAYPVAGWPAQQPELNADFGNPSVGNMLTADAYNFSSLEKVTIEWLIDGKVVANGSTYTPGLDLVGKRVQVRATGVRAGYADRVLTSELSAPLKAIESRPGTAGWANTPRVGQLAKVNTGYWAVGSKLSYQWLLDGKPIAGATSASYTPTLAQFGRKIDVKVTATKLGYETVSTSVGTATVFAGAKPAGTVAITGKAATGATLSATAASWPAGAKLSYQWLRDGRVIAKATGATHKLTSADTGKKISVRVSATLTGYEIPTKTSAAVKVAKGTQKAGKVAVSGTAKVKKKLTAKTSSFQAGTKLSYQWLRNGKTIKGATKASYTLTKADASTKVSVKVTAKLAGYNDRAVTSAAKKVTR